MKSKIALFATLLLVSILIIYSCSKQDKSTTIEKKQSSSEIVFTNPKQQMNSRLARRYVSQKLEGLNNSTSSTASTAKIKDLKLKVLWKKVYEGTTDSSSFVEVPIVLDKRSSSIITKQGQTVSPEDKKKILNASFDRLFISKSKTSGKINEFVITYIPTLECLNKSGGDVSNNHFNKLDKEFSGFLVLKTLGGKQLEMYQAYNGRITGALKKIDPSKRNMPNSKASTSVCTQTTQVCVQEQERQCWYELDREQETVVEECGEWYTTNSYCFDVCLSWSHDGPPTPPNPTIPPYTPIPSNPNPVGPCANINYAYVLSGVSYNYNTVKEDEVTIFSSADSVVKEVSSRVLEVSYLGASQSVHIKFQLIIKRDNSSSSWYFRGGSHINTWVSGSSTTFDLTVSNENPLTHLGTAFSEFFPTSAYTDIRSTITIAFTYSGCPVSTKLEDFSNGPVYSISDFTLP